MTEAKWHILEQRHPKTRSILFSGNLPVYPAIRQNRNSRYGDSPTASRIREYNAARGAIRDLLYYVMNQKGIEPFEKDERLAVSIVVWTDRAGDWDNYAKAVCDAGNRILYPDDKQIVKADVDIRFPYQASDVGFRVQVWSMPYKKPVKRTDLK